MQYKSPDVHSEAKSERPATTASLIRPAPRYTCRYSEHHELEAFRAAGTVIGEYVILGPSDTIDYLEGLNSGNDVKAGPVVRFFAEAGVNLGYRVIIGPRAQILPSVLGFCRETDEFTGPSAVICRFWSTTTCVLARLGRSIQA